MISEKLTAGDTLSKRWLKTPNAQALIIVAICAVSVLTFYILFDAASKIEYFKEILAALIGTLLTAVITTLLLKAQTSNEEERERGVELFRRKFDAYSAFIKLASLHTSDRNLSKDEAVELLSMFHNIRLLSSKETAESVFLFIEDNFLETGIPTFDIDNVVIVLKNDLFLQNETTEEDELIDTNIFVNLITTDQKLIDSHKSFAEDIHEKICSRFDDIDTSILESGFAPQYSSDYALLSYETSAGLTFNIQVFYEIIDHPESFLGVRGDIEIDSRLMKQDVIKAAQSVGFSFTEQKDEITFVIDLKTRKKTYFCEGQTIWSLRHFCDCVVDLERKISHSPDRSRS